MGEGEEVSTWLAWVGHTRGREIFDKNEVESAAVGNLAGEVAVGGKAGGEGVSKVETGDGFAVPRIFLALATAVVDGCGAFGTETCGDSRPVIAGKIGDVDVCQFGPGVDGGSLKSNDTEVTQIHGFAGEGVTRIVGGEVDANDILVVETVVFKATDVAAPFIEDGILFALRVFEVETLTEG